MIGKSIHHKKVKVYNQWRQNIIFEIIYTAWEVIVSKNQNSSMIRAKDSLNNGLTAVLAGYIAKGSQVGLLRLFTLHEKLLCPKTKALAWSEPKLEKRRFYRHFGGIYHQLRANWIFKIICTAWEVIVSKTKTLAWSEPKLEKRRFDRHFGGLNRQWRSNRISKINCTAWEVNMSKNQNFSMIRAKVSLSNGFTAVSAENNGNRFFFKDRWKYTP